MHHAVRIASMLGRRAPFGPTPQRGNARPRHKTKTGDDANSRKHNSCKRALKGIPNHGRTQQNAN
eukprot:10747501-Lingulodinium_polyedra.AAC.1